MSHRIDDRWLWLGAGIALLVAVKGISYAIQDTVRLTQVKPLGKDDDEELQRQPEDSIPLDVLRTLATSPNPNISKSAIDLIAARCVKTNSLVSSVQSDAASADPELRRKARAAMHFLSSWTLGSDMANHVPPGMRTGGSTGALNLSPSMLSLDSAYEFDQGLSLPPRLEAHHYDEGAVFEPSENGSAAVWTTVTRDGHDGPGSLEPDMRRRNREAMVMHGGTEVPSDEDIMRPQSM